MATVGSVERYVMNEHKEIMTNKNECRFYLHCQ